MKKLFITTPIYYINDAPHIGHAYTTIAADILARYYRQKNIDVYFLTGTDEHGTKVSQAAKNNHQEEKDYADDLVKKYQALWKKLNISYDYFVRTTDPGHEKFVQNFLQKLYDQGEIYEGEYRGLYCVGCEEYKNADELDGGEICPIHKKVCEKITENIYYFKLSKYQQQIINLIDGRQITIEPETRRNEVLHFLTKEPLKDLAISRSKVSWGIPVPWDRSQTIYVWFDALLNYLSASDGNFPPDIQLMAKDIFRFHAIIWPGLLLAAKEKLPHKLFIHGYFTINGQKMSKSLGNVIDPLKIIEKYSPDVLRYFLFREVPFGGDGDFSEAKLKQRYHSDLANDLGNLLQRVLVMREKYNIAWQYQEEKPNYPEIDKCIEDLNFSAALEKIWAIINLANRKIDQEKPWELATTNPDKLSNLIIELLTTLTVVSQLIYPFMPETSQKIIEQLKSLQPKPLFPKIN